MKVISRLMVNLTAATVNIAVPAQNSVLGWITKNKLDAHMTKSFFSVLN